MVTKKKIQTHVQCTMYILVSLGFTTAIVIQVISKAQNIQSLKINDRSVVNQVLGGHGQENTHHVKIYSNGQIQKISRNRFF